MPNHNKKLIYRKGRPSRKISQIILNFNFPDSPIHPLTHPTHQDAQDHGNVTQVYKQMFSILLGNMPRFLEYLTLIKSVFCLKSDLKMRFQNILFGYNLY